MMKTFCLATLLGISIAMTVPEAGSSGGALVDQDDLVVGANPDAPSAMSAPGGDGATAAAGAGGGCPGDVNGDGLVDVTDLLKVLGQWGRCNQCVADLDGNGQVDTLDLLEVLGSWGPCYTQGVWQVLPNSPLAPYYHHDDIFFIDENIAWVCNISGEIWKTTDAGDSWTRVWNQPGTSFRTLTFVDEMTGWVGNLGPDSWVDTTTDPNPLYATTDGGLTWTPILAKDISGQLPDGICGLQAIGPDTIHGAGRYAGDAYFISSTDGGASWVSQDLSTSYDAFVDVLFLTPDEGYITASNADGNAALLYTIDGGANWETVITNNAYHYWKIGFASDTFGYGVCWSGADADMWIQTYDGGETWTDRYFAGGYEANGIGFLNQYLGWIGGHEDNTYETTNGGNTWNLIQIDTVYGDAINKFLKVSDSVIYAVGNRVYKYSPEGAAAQAGPSPDGFDNSLCTLSASSCDGATALTYTVPEDDNVQITIYIRGGLIYDRPLDKHQQAGTYTIEFSAHDDTPVLYGAIVTGRYRQRIKFLNPR